MEKKTFIKTLLEGKEKKIINWQLLAKITFRIAYKLHCVFFNDSLEGVNGSLLKIRFLFLSPLILV